MDQAVGGVAVDETEAVRRQTIEERIPDDGVSEPVARTGRIEDAGSEGVVESGVGVEIIEARDGDELVGVEADAHDGHPLEGRSGGWIDPSDDVGVERDHPAGLQRRPPGQLGHRERRAAAERLDGAQHVVGRVGRDPAHEHVDLVRRQRSGHQLCRAVTAEKAPAHLLQPAAGRDGSVSENQADPVLVGRAGQVVQKAEAGVVGIVEVVDDEEHSDSRRRGPHERECSHEEALVGAVARPGHVDPAQRPFELVAILRSEPVEQCRILSTQLGQRLEHRRVRP